MFLWYIVVEIIVSFLPRSSRSEKRRFFRSIFNRIELQRTCKSFGRGVSLSLPSKLNRQTEVGNYVSLSALKVIGSGRCVIGNHFIGGEGCLLITSSHDYEGESLPYGSGSMSKSGVFLGECIWLGARVILLPGTILHDGVIVQAGAVVRGEIPKGAIVGGNPAQIIKFRNIEHYDDLAAKKSFRNTESKL